MFPAFSKIWLINVSLAVFIVFFGIKTFDVWSQGDGPIPEMRISKNPEKPVPEKKVMERTMPPDSNYAIVAEKNLFSSNRLEFIPEKQKQGLLKISEKQIFLYGVIVLGDRKKALISNPDPGPEVGKQLAKDKWVTLGDTIGTFKVADIQKDKIILTDGANSHEIFLYDKSKPARQVVAAEKAAAPSVVAAGSGGAAATRSDAKPVAGTPASRAADEKSAPAAEYRIINTPFGPTKQRIQ
jgi:hypothetical protein